MVGLTTTRTLRCGLMSRTSYIVSGSNRYDHRRFRKTYILLAIGKNITFQVVRNTLVEPRLVGRHNHKLHVVVPHSGVRLLSSVYMLETSFLR